MGSAGGSKTGHFPQYSPMSAADLPSLEQRLEACLIELERLYQVRPSLPDALGRAGAGQRIEELLDQIAELQQEITLRPAVTLQDAAVKLRRLSVYLGGPGARAATGGGAGGRGEGCGTGVGRAVMS